MKNSNSRAQIFAELSSLSEKIPEMRAAQLMAAIGELSLDLHGRGLWDADDNEFLEAVWQFQRNFEVAKTAVNGHQAEPTAEADRGRDGSPGSTPSEAAPAA